MSLEFLQQHWIQRLGWTLIHFLWQGAILAVIFAVVRRVLRSASPNTRYLAGCATLLLMFAVAALTFARQESAPVRRATPTQATQVGLPALERTTPVDVVSVKALRTTQTRTPVVGFWTQVPAKLEAHMPWLVALWIAGVAMFSLRLFTGWIKVVSLRSRHNQPVDAFWLERLQQLKQKLGVSRPVRLLKSTAVEVPTAIGWLCPVILLPASSLLGLNPAQVESILAHELAHIRRQDYLVNLLQCLAETLLFYHPAVWWVSNAIRAERENCCDDMAVQVCGDALGYAKALATLEELRGTPTSLAMAANGKPLLHRIRRLLGQDAENRLSLKGSSGGILGLLLVLTFFIILPLAHSQKPAQAVQGQSVRQTHIVNSPKHSSGFDLRTLTEEWKYLARTSDTNFSLASRLFKVDSKALLAEMDKAAPKLPVERDQDGAISILHRLLLAKTGVDFTAPGRMAVFNDGSKLLIYNSRKVDFSDGKGRIMVHATPEEMNKVQKYIQSLNNNAAQVTEGSNDLSHASNTNGPLAVRQFKVDSNALLAELTKAAPKLPVETEQDGTISTLQKVLLAKTGVDISAPGRSAVFSDGSGRFMVRATPEELDKVEKYIQSVNSNAIQVTEASKDQSRPSNTNVTLHVRQYRVDPSTFLIELNKVAKLPGDSDPDDIIGKFRSVFSEKLGIDILADGRTVVYSHGKGMLMVRATIEELDQIENVIQSLSPPQLVYEYKFVQFVEEKDQPFNLGDILKGQNLFQTTNAQVFHASNVVVRGIGKDATTEVAANITGYNPPSMAILTKSQFQAVIHSLENRPGVDFNPAAPKVTSLSGRQTEMKVVDTMRVPDENSVDPANPATVDVELGSVVDTIGYVAKETATIQLSAIASLTEYFSTDLAVDPASNSRPKPIFRQRHANGRVTLFDSQTVVLDAGVSYFEVKPPVPTIGRFYKQKRLLIFVTPTIVDWSGNRIHKEDAETVPEQIVE